MTTWVNGSRWRRYAAAVTALCVVIGTWAALAVLRPTAAEWTDPVYARGEVQIGTWSIPPDAVSAGNLYTCLRITGRAWCSGQSNSNAPKTGQLANTNLMTLVPAGMTAEDPGTQVTRPISQLDTGSDQTCVVADGAAYCWGIQGGALGNYKTATPWEMLASKDPVAVYAGDNDGTTWGYRSPLFQQTVTRVFVGEQIGCVLMSTGRAACWGLYTGLTRPPESSTDPRKWVIAPILVPTTTEDPASQLPPGSVILGITTEFQNSCAILATGPMYCWGANVQSQLGLPAGAVRAPRALPRGASGTGPITSAAMGKLHLCFLSGGKSFCSGLRASGALGDGSESLQAETPVATIATGVLAGVTLTKIVAGDRFTCAMSNAGRAYCWGQNDVGQLGNNASVNSSVPVAVDMSQLPAGVTFTDIDAGTTHMCALGSDRKVYCWGGGSQGELATGTTPNAVLRPSTPITDTWTS